VLIKILFEAVFILFNKALVSSGGEKNTPFQPAIVTGHCILPIEV